MFSTPMDRHCEECKRPLKGRKDQKFCSDYCRNTYNNRQNEDSNKYVRKVNNILRRNRRILGALLRNKEINKELQELAELGFNFRYFTNTLTDDDGNPLYFCYELGYKREGGIRCKIIEKTI
jgi:predicted nucleic acid-binding Zn ribbon protein